MRIGDVIATADWKTEKHVPAIELPESIKKGEPVQVRVCVGKDISHPNTTEHHIKWIDTYFKPDGGKFVFHLARAEFGVHGESPKGANEGPVHTEACALFGARFEESGTVIAVAYCNIHGLWESSAKVEVV